MRPRPVVGEATVPDAVRRLLDKFDYPDRESPVQIIPILPSLGGGGGAPTVVVAASDASELSKSKSDYLCTGVNDQDTIQTALDSMDQKGRLLFTEGSFNLIAPNAGPAVTVPSDITLEGFHNSTWFYATHTTDPGAGSSLFRLNSYDTLSNLNFSTFDSVDAISTQAGFLRANIRIYDCEFQVADDARAIHMDRTQNAWIARNFIDCLSAATNPAVDMPDSQDIWFTDNYVTGGEWGIKFNYTTFEVIQGLHIRGNYFFLQDQGAVLVDQNESNNVPFVWITENFIQQSGQGIGAYADQGAIHIIGDSSDAGGSPSTPAAVGEPSLFILDNQVEGTSLLDGIYLQYINLATVRGNYVENTENGIVLDDCGHNTVSGNRVLWSNQDNATDAIKLINNCTRNYVHTNTIRNDVPAAQWRYGVNIGGSGECNMVVGNDLGDKDDYGTDALVDTASNTQLFWPNDATYGDNFTDCGSGS